MPPESWVFRPLAEFKAQANLGNFVVYKRGPRGRVKRSGNQFAQISGFTLLELLVVCAVVALLLGVTAGALRSARQRTLVLQARAELAVLSQALADYRRTWGEYPCTGACPQAQPEPGPSNPLVVGSSQAKLFNALAGVITPAGSPQADVRAGRVFLDAARFRFEIGLDQPPAWPAGRRGEPAREVANAILDPWGRRYLYFYKQAPGPVPSWKAPAYVLFSAGPDGAYTIPPGWSGVVDEPFSELAVDGELVNADNLYALPQ
ncbi:MAG: hypothetical protein BWX86_01019 [Verrucomicrobia bacterium ADurb.Bin122]|nr:MAG: hypothetical protein BWX86_01019 [Verrucomicrobia bacterium ADurb.Bin122]